MADIDPFTRGYQTIRNTLLASSEWTALITSANFHDLTENGYAKNVVKGGRTPAERERQGEAMLSQGRFTLLPFGGNSGCANISQAYVLRMTTGKLKITTINTIKWAALRALRAWGTDLRQRGFIYDWRITDGIDAISPQQDQHTGYVSVLAVWLDMYVPNVQLTIPT